MIISRGLRLLFRMPVRATQGFSGENKKFTFKRLEDTAEDELEETLNPELSQGPKKLGNILEKSQPESTKKPFPNTFSRKSYDP